MRRTKIVATLGPASVEPRIFRQMVDSGLDVARINLSHGDVERHRQVIHMVREVERLVGRPIGIMMDTSGPEVRLRTLKAEGVAVKQGDVLTLGDGDGADLMPSLLKFSQLLAVGERLVIGDGNVVLEVFQIDSRARASLRVLQGTYLDNNKKVTCTGQTWDLPVLTDADRAALRMGIEEGIDWIAASFIRRPEDVVEVRRQVELWGGADVPIMAKIETRLAIENLDMIARLADGLMVARGDLGVEYPPEDVPWLQKQIIEASSCLGKPVVTATQMLESMVHSSRPTRAEITDIAHAVLEGSDAVMLSEETAVGDFPVEAVRVMAKAAEVSEAHPWDGLKRGRYGSSTVTDAVCHAALTAAEDLEARLIITATESGHTAQSMAAHRPRVPVLALTPYERVGRRLTLVWGLRTQIMNTHTSLEGMVEEAVAIAVQSQWAGPGDRLIITVGAPVGEAGSTNVLRVVSVGHVLLRGQGLGPEGEVHGVVRLVGGLGEIEPEELSGKVLVVSTSDGDWTPYMERARAIVAEAGGLTSHAAIVGISLGIPTVIGVAGAMSQLSDGQLVTVDAVAGTIRQGPGE